MPKTTLILVLGTILAIVSQACTPAVPATPDSGAVQTAIAQTQGAAPTETSGIPVTGPDTPTATLFPSPEPATQTPTALVLPSPIFTPTLGAPEIRVIIPTNCRLGPGVSYARVGGLQPGQVAEIVGRHETRDYWVIREPNRNVICWLWGEYATVTGNTNVLPIYTPPPTPTPLPTATATPTLAPVASFAASYSGLESCAGVGWWVDLELRNNGGITFQSLALTMTDTVTNTVLPLDPGNFIDRNGCNETETRPDLPPGATRIVSAPVFPNDLTGHRLLSRITLCSNPGLSGTCTSRVIEFTP